MQSLPAAWLQAALASVSGLENLKGKQDMSKAIGVLIEC